MKAILVISAIAAIFIFYYVLGPLPLQFKLVFIFFSVIFIYPIAYFMHDFLPRYASRKLHKRMGIDEHEFYENPRRYFALRKQAKNLKRLAKKKITTVNILRDGNTIGKLRATEDIDDFKNFLLGNIVFSVGGELDDHIELEISTDDTNYSYQAYTISGNTDDIILKFPECDDYGGIQLTGLKRWLDKNISNRED